MRPKNPPALVTALLPDHPTIRPPRDAASIRSAGRGEPVLLYPRLQNLHLLDPHIMPHIVYANTDPGY